MDLSIFDSIASMENVFGGQDFISNGEMIGHSQPNIFGGEDYHFNDGQENYSTQDNALGGKDILSNGQHAGHTESNVFGGENLYDSNNEMTGHSEPNIFGGENVFDASGNMTAQTSPNIFGGQNIDPLQAFKPSSVPSFSSSIGRIFIANNCSFNNALINVDFPEENSPKTTTNNGEL